MGNGKTAIAVRMETVKDIFEQNKKALQEAVPRHIGADRLMRTALTSIRKTPDLLQCTPASLLSCVLQSAAVGLEPDTGLGEAYLIPYKTTATQGRKQNLVGSCVGLGQVAPASGPPTGPGW